MMPADVTNVVVMLCAAAAGALLAVAAKALARRGAHLDALEFDGGYNALAPIVDR